MIRLINFFIIAFLLESFLFQTSKAQNEVRVTRSEFKTEKDSFRQAFRHIRKADASVKLGHGGLSQALDHYLQAYRYNSNSPELNYKIGMTYLRSCPKEKALPYLKAASEKKPELTKDLTLQLARAYQYNLDFDTAMQKYGSYLKSLSKRQQKKQKEQVDAFVSQCKSGLALNGKSKRAVISNAGDEINSSFDDYNAISLSDSLLYFSSRRPSKKRDKPSSKGHMYDEDVYISKSTDGIWQKPTYLKDPNINTKHNEDIVWVSEDGKTRCLYDGYNNGGDILISTFKKGEWTDPKKISRKLKTKGMETCISFTRDGNTLFFVSDDGVDNIGGRDIYVSHKDKKGRWSDPENLGSTINTKLNEESVYISPDGNVMYFSSQGHNSMGGYDIFRTEKDAGGKWSKPENLGFPINSPDDELFYRPSENERTAWFSAQRQDTRGGFDIYKVIYLGSEKKMRITTDQQLIAYNDKPVSDIFARISGEEVISNFMSGIITDVKKKTPIVAKIDLIDIEKSTVLATTLSDSTGAYRLRLPESKKYGIEIHAKDYMLFLETVDIPDLQGKDFQKNFALAKVEVGTKIVLKNIYFETGKAVLTSESNIELDKVVKFMQDNTEIKVEISGHTDNTGSATANTKLSEARAKSVVQYLTSHGIDPQKLVYKGYGLAQPIASNKTAAGRQMNRRVEFKILSVE